MKRYSDIKVLLELADETLVAIEREYDAALHAKEIPAKLPGRIKTLLDQLRTPLDFISKEIAEVKLGHGGKAYFPAWCRTRQEFDRHIQQNLPNLQIREPAVYAELEKVQGYNQNGCKALGRLNTLVNENKHDQLTPQIRNEQRTLEIKFPGGASIVMGEGASISGFGTFESNGAWVGVQGGDISVDSPATMGQGVQQNLVRWVSFIFAGSSDEVLPLLKQARNDVETVVGELRPLLWP